jgi:hypothetical protein
MLTEVHGAVCQEVTQRLKIVRLASTTTIVPVGPAISRAEVNESRLREMIVKMGQFTFRNLRISAVSKFSVGSAYNTVHEELQYRAVCARPVQKCLAERHNIDVSRWLSHILHCFTNQKDEFVGSILRDHYMRHCAACFGSGVRLSSLVLRPVAEVDRN